MYFLELVFFIIFKILKTISIPLALVDAKKTIAYPAKNCVNENAAGILEIMLEIIFMTKCILKNPIPFLMTKKN
jgi:hypothetical protein